jgi:hypothetical protein
LLSLTTPVAMGYIPLGMVFGFLFVQAGGAAWLAVLSSIVVYAGAAQYMMVPMLAAGLPVGAIALATAVVNLRHVFYGLSLLDRLPERRGLRWILAFCLTDETYSVLTALPQHPGPPAGGGGAAQPGLVDAGHGPGRPAGHAAAAEPARAGLRAGRPVRRADGGAMAAAPQRRPAVDRAGGLRSGPGRGAGPCPGHRHRPEPGGGPGVAQPPPPRQLPEHQA